MDMHEASRILSMDILGLTPEDFDDRENDDFTPCEWDDAYDETEEPRGQEYTLSLYFDASTDLEAILIVSAILATAKRSTAENIRHELTN